MRLLYVEDDRISAIVFQEALKQQGLDLPRVAETGAEALEIVWDWAPEVLVIDSFLPDCSGSDLLRRLREVPGLARVPAFMCSANTLPEDMRAAMNAGFNGYWVKPIDIPQVVADLAALAARATE